MEVEKIVTKTVEVFEINNQYEPSSQDFFLSSDPHTLLEDSRQSSSEAMTCVKCTIPLRNFQKSKLNFTVDVIPNYTQISPSNVIM